MKRIALIALISAVVAVAPVSAESTQSARTVDVTGHGEAKARPNTVVISFAVEDQADSADACTAEHAAKVRKLIDTLKQKIGDEAKIATGDYSLNPTTIFVETAASAAPPIAPGIPWTVSIWVNLESDSLDDLGKAIDGAIAAGASNRIQESGFRNVPIELLKKGATALSPPAVSGPLIGSAMGYWNGQLVPMKQVPFSNVEVETEGATVAECMRKADAIVNRIRKQVGGNGRVSLSLGNLNISPKQPQQPRYAPPPPPRPQKQVFQARSTVTVESTKLDQLGEAVQTGLTSGAARLNNITFTLSNDSAARKEAIDKASAEARSKAEEVAKSMGVKLGQVLRISTNAVPQPRVIYGGNYQHSFSARAVPAAAQLPVMPREVGFSADVSVSYAIE